VIAGLSQQRDEVENARARAAAAEEASRQTNELLKEAKVVIAGLSQQRDEVENARARAAAAEEASRQTNELLKEAKVVIAGLSQQMDEVENARARAAAAEEASRQTNELLKEAKVVIRRLSAERKEKKASVEASETKKLLEDAKVVITALSSEKKDIGESGAKKAPKACETSEAYETVKRIKEAARGLKTRSNVALKNILHQSVIVIEALCSENSQLKEDLIEASSREDTYEDYEDYDTYLELRDANLEIQRLRPLGEKTTATPECKKEKPAENQTAIKKRPEGRFIFKPY
jgi:hypothetical protein